MPRMEVRHVRRALVAVLLTLGVLGSWVGVAQAATPGAITPLTGSDFCFEQDSQLVECEDSRGTYDASNVAFSPDGEHVYVAGGTDGHGSLAAFDRNPSTGKLTQLAGADGCYDADAADACTDVHGMTDPAAMVMSADGQHLYVASFAGHYSAIAHFTRDPATGALTQDPGPAGCMASDAVWWSADGCATLRAASRIHDIALSPDGAQLYAVGMGEEYYFSHDTDSVVVLDRDTTSGQLTQDSDAASCVVNRGPAFGCVDGRGLDDPGHVTVSPDGRNVYVTAFGSNALTTFARNLATGRLTQLEGEDGCIRSRSTAEDCQSGVALEDPQEPLVSPDGTDVYVASSWGGHVAQLRRRADGTLRQDLDRDACWSFDGAAHSEGRDPLFERCRKARGLQGATALAMDTAGTSLYAGNDASNAITAFSRDTSGDLLPLPGTAACTSDFGDLPYMHRPDFGYWTYFYENGACGPTGRTGSLLQLGGRQNIALAPDGRHLIAAARDGGQSSSGAISVFARSATSDPAAEEARAWDLGSDMRARSAADNPSPDAYGAENVWAFVSLDDDPASDGTIRVPLPDHDPQQGRWFDAATGDGTPAVRRYAGSAPLVHPAPGRPVAVEWENPGAGGTFQVQGAVTHTHACGDGVSWSLDKVGGASIASGAVYLDTGRIDQEVTLGPGDTLRLTVAPQGSYSCDSTWVDLRVTGPVDAGPNTTIVAPSPKGVVQGTSHVFAFASDEPGATYECRMDRGAWGACASGDSFAAAHGERLFEVRATAGGVTDPTPARRSFEVDDVRPVVTITDGPVGATRQSTVRFEFESSEDGPVLCRVDAAPFERCGTERVYGELADGSHTFQAKTTDPAGNESLVASRAFTLDTSGTIGQPGALTQLGGDAGCRREPAEDGCVAGERLDGAISVAVTPDGKSAYAVSHEASSLLVFDRDTSADTPLAKRGRLVPKTGADRCLTYWSAEGCRGDQAGLYYPTDVVATDDAVYVSSYYHHRVTRWLRASDGTLSQPQSIVPRGGQYPADLALAPDGQTLYVAAENSDALVVIARNADGTISQPAGAAGCVNGSGADGCAKARGLDNVVGVAVSPDGQNVYVTSTHSAWWDPARSGIAAFERRSDGTVTQLGGEEGCYTDGAVQDCVDATALLSARSVVVSPDGRNVYVSVNDGVAVLQRDADGALHQEPGVESCISSNPNWSCVRGRFLDSEGNGLAISPDGRSVYVTDISSNALSVLRRDGQGRLHQLAGREGCWSHDGSRGGCHDGAGLDFDYSASSVTVSPDGANVYAAGRGGDSLAAFRRIAPRDAAQPQLTTWDAYADFKRADDGRADSPDRYGTDAVWEYASVAAGPDGAGRATGTRALLGTYGAPAERAAAWFDGSSPTQWLTVGVSDDKPRVFMHPERASEGGESAQLTWKNPVTSTATYRVQLALEREYPDSDDGVRWALDREGPDGSFTEIASGVMPKYERGLWLDRDLELVAGDKLHLTLSPRTDYDNDHTLVDLTITGDAEPFPQTTITEGPGRQTTDATPAFSFASSAAAAAFECSVDGGAWSSCASGGSLATLADGEHDLRVRATDGGVVDRTPARRAFRVDATAPTVEITAGPTDGAVERDAEPTFTFTASESGRRECRVDGGAWTPCLSPHRLPELTDGEHTFEVRAVDRAGNVSDPSPSPLTRVARTWRVDTGAGSLQPGALAQLNGTRGCVSQNPDLGCAPATRTGRPHDGAFSPDGRFLYVPGHQSDSVVVFERTAVDQPGAGRLTQLTGTGFCVTETPQEGCADGRALDGAWGVEVTADNVYVSARDGDAVAAFSRDATTGALTQLAGEAGCVRWNSTSDGCRAVRGLDGAQNLEVTAGQLYVAAQDYGGFVTVLDRMPGGGLEQRPGAAACWSLDGRDGCRDGRGLDAVEDIELSGGYAYVTSTNGHAVLSFERKGDGSLEQLPGQAGCVQRDGAEGCADGRNLLYARSLEVAPDGRHAYVASEGNALDVLLVEPDGGLSPLAGARGCLDQTREDGCADADGLEGGMGLVISPDGRNVYATSRVDDAVTSFARADDGTLRQLSGADACTSETGSGGRCRNGKALDLGYGPGLVGSPDGQHVYALATESHAVSAFARRAPAAADAPDDLVWDAAADFRTGSLKANPSPDRHGWDDVWSYRTSEAAPDGTGRSPGSGLAGYPLLGHWADNDPWGDDYPGPRWAFQSNGNHPVVGLTKSGRLMHDPEHSRNTVLAWRNPTGAPITVNVSGLVQDMSRNSGGDGVRWYVDNGADELRQGSLGPNSDAQGFDVTTTVPADGHLFFHLARTGEHWSDDHFFDVTISGPAQPGPQTRITSGPSATTTTRTPSFGFSSQTGDGFECRVDDAAWSACSSPLQLAPQSEGAHTFQVRATAGAAKDRTPATRAFRVDTDAPGTLLDAGPDAFTRDRTPTWTWTMADPEPGASFRCSLDGAPFEPCASGYTAPELASGAHTFEIRAQDRWGNLEASEPISFTVDLTSDGLQFGALSQLPGSAACATDPATLGCAAAAGVRYPTSVSVSPDSRHVYVTSDDRDQVTVFARASSGALTQLSCVNPGGTDGCTAAGSMGDPRAVTFDAAGSVAYVASRADHLVRVFTRDAATGALSPLAGEAGCVRNGSSAGGCTAVRGLYDPYTIAVGAEHVYVAGRTGSTVAVLDRATGGGLSQRDGLGACVVAGADTGDCRGARALYNPSDLALVGDDLYVGTTASDAIAHFTIAAGGALTQPPGEAGCVRSNSTSEGCRSVRRVGEVYALEADPQGTHLYAADEGEDAIAILAIGADGELTQAGTAAGCLANGGTGTDGNCERARGLYDVSALAMAPDGRTLYAASAGDRAISSFRRDPGTGALRQLAGADACWSSDGSGGGCRDGKAITPYYDRPQQLAVTPDGGNVYGVSARHYAWWLGGDDAHGVTAFSRRVPRSIALPPIPEWNAAEDFDPAASAAVSADRYGNPAVWEYLRGNGNGVGVGRDRAGYLTMARPGANGEYRRWWDSYRDAGGAVVADDHPFVGLRTDRTLRVHPGAEAPAVVRWTYAGDEASTVQVHLRVTDADHGSGWWALSDGVQWILDHDGRRIGSGRLPNAGTPQRFDRPVEVEPGDVLELVVAAGDAESWDSTDVDFHVTGAPVTDTFFTDDSARGLVNDDTPTFNAVSTEAGASYECRVTPTAGLTGSGTWQACDQQPFTVAEPEWEIAPLADGPYLVEARSIAGGVTESSPAKRQIKVDRTAPSPAIDAPANDGVTSSHYPTLAGDKGDLGDGAAHGPDVDTVRLRVWSGAGTSGEPIRDFTVDTDGARWSSGLNGYLDDGRYTVTATQRDEAGNQRESAPRTLVVDSVAPVAATFTAPPAETNQGRPTVTAQVGSQPGTGTTSRDDDQVTVRIYAGTSNTLVKEFTATRAEDGTVSAQMPALETGDGQLANGLYNVRVTQGDKAGNVSTSPAPNVGRQFKVDRNPPAVLMNEVEPGAREATDDRTPTFTGTAGTATTENISSADAMSVTLTIHAGSSSEGAQVGPAVQAPRDVNSGAYTATAGSSLADGTYTAVVAQSDGATNVGRAVRTFEVDDSGPSLTLSAPDADTNLKRPAIRGTGGTLDGSAADSVADDPAITGRVVRASTGTEVASLDGTLGVDGAFEVQPSADLPEGTYRATARQEDTLDNPSEAARDFKVDYTKPVTTLELPAGGQEISDTTPTFEGTAGTEDGSHEQRSADATAVTLELVKGATTVVVPGVRDGGTVSITVPADRALAPGVWTATLRQSDAAGNEGASGPVVFEVDTTAPALTVTSPPADTKDAKPAISGAAGDKADDGDDGAAADAGVIDVRVEGLTDPSASRDLDTTRSGATWTADWGTAAALPAGRYRVTVRQADDAENERVVTRDFKVDLTDPAPGIDGGAHIVTNDRTPTLAGDAGDQDGTAQTQSLDAPVVAVKVGSREPVEVTRSGARWSYTPDTLDEGHYLVTVTQADAATRNGSAERHLKIDLTAPSPTVGAVTPYDRRTVPALAGTAGTEDGAGHDAASSDDQTVDVAVHRVSSGTKVDEVLDVPVAGGAWSVAASALELPADGRYEVRVTQGDAAGNARTVTGGTFRYDTTAPVVTLTAPEGDTNDTTPTLTGTRGTETGAAQNEASADQPQLRVSVSGTSIQDQPVDAADGSFSVPIPSPLDDGTYEVTFSQADAAGNQAASAPKTFKVDTAAPVLSQTAPVDDAHFQPARPRFAGAAGAEDGSHRARSRDSNVTIRIWAGDTAAGAPAREFELPVSGAGFDGAMPLAQDGLAEGEYAWRAFQSDAAGNAASTSDTGRTFYVDRTAPAATLDAQTDVQGTPTPTLTGSLGSARGDLAGTLTIRRQGSTTVLQSYDLPTGGFSKQLTALEDGTYVATLTQRDRAENAAAPTATFKVDDTAPAPAVTGPAVTNAARPVISGTAGAAADDATRAADDAQVQVTLRRAGEVDVTFPATRDGSSWSQATPSALAEGRWTATVAQGDGAVPENVGTSAGFDVVVDRTGPAPDELTPAAGTATNDTTPEIGARLRTSSGTGETAADATSATVTIHEGTSAAGTQVGDPYVDSTPDAQHRIAVTPAPLARGTYTARVCQQDAAGNTGCAERTFKVDTTAPAVTVDALADDHQQTRRPAFQGDLGTLAAAAAESGDGAVEVTATRGATSLALVVDVTGGRWSAGPATDLEDGLWTIEAVQRDGAGNRASAQRTFRVDNDAPAPALTTPADGHRTKDTTPTVGGARSSEPGDRTTDPVTVTFTRGAATVGGDVTDDAGAFTAVPEEALADGEWTVRATQVDGAGNAGDSTARTVVVDTAAPALGMDAIASPRNTIPALAGDRGQATGDLGPVALDVPGASVEVDGGRWSATLPALADGSHTVTATQSDDVGNSASASRTFVLDRVDPAVTLDTPPADTNDATPTLAGDAGAVVGASADATSVTVDLEPLDGQADPDPATAPVSGGAWELTPSALADGRYEVTVTQSDAAGNTATAGPKPVRVDTSAPSPTVHALDALHHEAPSFTGDRNGADGQGRPSRDGAVTLELFAGDAIEDGEEPVHLVSATPAGVNGWTASRALADGTYTVRARQSDAAQNTGYSSPRTFKLDDTDPSVSLTAPDGDTRDTTPLFSGAAGDVAGSAAASADADAVVVEIHDDAGAAGEPVATLEAARSGATWSVVAGALPEGSYWARAIQRDAAGNEGRTALRAFRVDTTAPGLSVTVPAWTNDATPAIAVGRGSAEGDLPAVTVTARRDGETDRVATAPAGTDSATLGTLTEGDWAVAAAQSDRAGNEAATAPQTLRVDLTRPVAAITAPAAAAELNDATPELTGTAGEAPGDLATVELTLTAPGQVTRTAAAEVAGGTWSHTPSTALADARWTLEVVQRDRAGNASVAATRSFVVDAAPPAVTLTAPADGAATNDPTPAIAGTAGLAPGDRAAVTVEIRQGATVVQTRESTRGGDGAWSVEAEPLADGTYTVVARQLDNGGNAGESAARTFRVDTVKPAPTITGPADGTEPRPTFAGAAGDAAGDAAQVAVQVLQGSTVVQALGATRAGTSWSVRATAPLAPGTYRAVATQLDAAGNAGVAERTFTVQATQLPPPPDVTKPQVSQFKPAAGTDIGALVGSRGAAFSITLSEPADVVSQLMVPKRLGKGLGVSTSATSYVTIAKVTRKALGAGTQTIRFKLSKKARRKLRKARRLPVVVRTVVVDLAGNATVSSNKVTLKR